MWLEIEKGTAIIIPVIILVVVIIFLEGIE